MDIPRLSMIVIGLSILIRAVTFLLSANFDADSISRSFISLGWAQKPFLIWHPNSQTSVWLPLQFYISGFILMIWDNVRLAPRLISLIASMASLPLFLALAGRLFDRERAWLATACFSLFALGIKFGNIAGSESLFIFTVLAVMYAYHRFLDNPDLAGTLTLSVALLAAVMIRFEAWILPLFVFVALTWRSRFLDKNLSKKTLMGGFAACILPGLFMILWMYGSYREYGDILYSVHAAASEHIELNRQTIASIGLAKSLIYRGLFWPGVLFVSLSPFIILGGLWGLWRTFFKQSGVEWALFFVLQVGIYLYKSLVTGELAPLARYTILPGTILCLFSARGLFDLAGRFSIAGNLKPKIMTILGFSLIWLLLLCPNYRESGSPYLKKLASISPITQYPATVEPIIGWLKTNLRSDQKVIFNSPAFTANAIIMYSGMTLDQMVSVDENDPADVRRRTMETDPAFLICHRRAPLRKNLDSDLATPIIIDDLTFRIIDSVGDFGVYIPQREP